MYNFIKNEIIFKKKNRFKRMVNEANQKIRRLKAFG